MSVDKNGGSGGGLVELKISHALTWAEFRAQAQESAGGLPTCDELKEAGVTAGDGVDLWMPVQREDGRLVLFSRITLTSFPHPPPTLTFPSFPSLTAREGDFCQIGNHPMNKTRYISHIDQYGMPGWYQNNDAAGWRPGPNSSACKGIFYARRN